MKTDRSDQCDHSNIWVSDNQLPLFPSVTISVFLRSRVSLIPFRHNFPVAQCCMPNNTALYHIE